MRNQVCWEYYYVTYICANDEQILKHIHHFTAFVAVDISSTVLKFFKLWNVNLICKICSRDYVNMTDVFYHNMTVAIFNER